MVLLTCLSPKGSDFFLSSSLLFLVLVLLVFILFFSSSSSSSYTCFLECHVGGVLTRAGVSSRSLPRVLLWSGLAPSVSLSVFLFFFFRSCALPSDVQEKERTEEREQEVAGRLSEAVIRFFLFFSWPSSWWISFHRGRTVCLSEVL